MSKKTTHHRVIYRSEVRRLPLLRIFYKSATEQSPDSPHACMLSVRGDAPCPQTHFYMYDLLECRLLTSLTVDDLVSAVHARVLQFGIRSKDVRMTVGQRTELNLGDRRSLVEVGVFPDGEQLHRKAEGLSIYLDVEWDEPQLRAALADRLLTVFYGSFQKDFKTVEDFEAEERRAVKAIDRESKHAEHKERRESKVAAHAAEERIKMENMAKKEEKVKENTERARRRKGVKKAMKENKKKRRARRKIEKQATAET